MINNGQTYAEYLETMRAYNFNPMDYELWFDWMLSKGVIIITDGDA